MILHTQLPKDDRGNIKAQKSAYNPSKEVKDLTAQVLKDFNLGYETMHKPYREFNDMSLLERQSKDQQSFNSYRAPKSTDPDEVWKSNAFRPIVRNRVISIAAHVTGSLIFPQIQAQNEYDKEDKDAATVMRDLMEWAAEQSNYEKTFLYSVIAALVNPAVIIHTQYTETYRTIKEILENGRWKEKEVLDEALSGFQDSPVPLDELFIGDIYEEDIQKQPFLIHRRAIDFATAEAKYGDHPNFKKYVRPGLQVMFSEASDQFYEAYDPQLQERLVEEIVYRNRSSDLEVPFLNGVIVAEHDQPNPRKDKRYPYAKTGYETFDEGKFFYYKSMVFKMGPDEEVINTLYRMIIDGSFLKLMPPTMVFGSEAVTSSVTIPGMVTAFQDPNTKMQQIDVGGDLNAGFSTLDRVEASLSESSNDVLQSGQASKGNQTAFEISRLEQNAKTMLGLFGKMIGFLVKEFGELRVSDIVQFLTVGDMQEITGESGQLKFRSFLLADKTVEGKKKARKIEFDPYMPSEVTEDQQLEHSFDIMDEEGGLDADLEIYKTNPALFRSLKFKVKVTPDIVTPPSDNVKKAMLLEEYDRAIANPFADQEAVTRDFLFGAYDASKYDTDKYMKKPEQMMQEAMQMQGQQGGMTGKLASPGKPGGTNELMQKVV